jgi:hypothetical protein
VAIFQEKCVCCGHRTSERHDGRPTCESCRRVLELKLAAASEQRHACPVDGAMMTKTVAHMMVIDRCPTCHGVWLDAGELDNLTAEAAREAMLAIARGVWSTS